MWLDALFRRGENGSEEQETGTSLLQSVRGPGELGNAGPGGRPTEQRTETHSTAWLDYFDWAPSQKRKRGGGDEKSEMNGTVGAGQRLQAAEVVP